MARTSNLIQLMDQVAKTPISPITNIESVYYEQKVNEQVQRISIASNLPVSYVDLNDGGSDCFVCDTDVSQAHSYLPPLNPITFDENTILSNIDIRNYVHNRISDEGHTYDYYKVAVKLSKDGEEPSDKFKFSYLEQQIITETDKLSKIVESTYNLAQIFTDTLNGNDEIIHNSLVNVIDYVNTNLITVYNAIQKERQITHKYYDSVSDIFNGNYRESDLSWGYDLAVGHTINDNVVIVTDPYTHEHSILNLNGHANNELDPISGLMDSTTITNIFNGLGLDFLNNDIFINGYNNIENLQYRTKIFKILNTEYTTGLSTSSITFNESLTTRVAESKIYKIILKVSGLANDGARVSICKINTNNSRTENIIGSDVIIKNGWNTIPVNQYEFKSTERLAFYFLQRNGAAIALNVNIHALHIFGLQILTNASEDGNFVNVNKLYNKYTNDNNFVKLPGTLQLDSYGIINDNMNCLTIGKDSKKHLVLTTNGHLKAFNNETYSELYLNAPYVLENGEDNSANTGGDIIMSGAGKTVTNNGTLTNKEKIVGKSATESNKLFVKNGFYLSSYASEDAWIDYDQNHDIIPTSRVSYNYITGFRNNQSPYSAEIASENQNGNTVLGLRVAGGPAIASNQLIQINVGNADSSNNRNPQYAKASIELNAKAHKVTINPVVVINSLDNIQARLKISAYNNGRGDIDLSDGQITTDNVSAVDVSTVKVHVDELYSRNNSEIIVKKSLTMDSDNYQLTCSRIMPVGGSAETLVVDGNLRAKINGRTGILVGVPVGTIMMWPATNPPEGWLLCDGKTYNKNDHPNLYAVIKTQYGGNASNNTFAVPDFRGMFPVGAGQAPNTYLNEENKNLGYNFYLGQNDPNVGEYKHKLSGNEMPSHKHDKGTLDAQGYLNYVYPTTNKGTSGVFDVSSTWNSNIKGGGASDSWGKNTKFSLNGKMTGLTGATGQDSKHNNVPPFVCINFIIKCN